LIFLFGWETVKKLYIQPPIYVNIPTIKSLNFVCFDLKIAKKCQFSGAFWYFAGENG